jgi:hypothetical protein
MIEHICIICDGKSDTALACAHMFCVSCVVELIRKRSRKCPICRTRITFDLPSIQRHIKLRQDSKNE